MAKAKQAAVPRHRFSDMVEDALAEITNLASAAVEGQHARWYAIKLFERDEKIKAELGLPTPVQEKICLLYTSQRAGEDHLAAPAHGGAAPWGKYLIQCNL